MSLKKAAGRELVVIIECISMNFPSSQIGVWERVKKWRLNGRGVRLASNLALKQIISRIMIFQIEKVKPGRYAIIMNKNKWSIL